MTGTLALNAYGLARTSQRLSTILLWSDVGSKTFYERPDFSRADDAISAGEVIRWWESRRLFFNVTVGLTGLVTCVLLVICAFQLTH